MKQIVVIFPRILPVSVTLFASTTMTVVMMLRKNASRPIFQLNFQPISQQLLFRMVEVLVEVLAIPAIQETARHLVKLVVLMIHQVVVHLILTTCVSAILFVPISMTVAMTLKKYVFQLMFQQNLLQIVQLILHLIVEVSVSVQVLV
jgi:hypothetical protein